MEVDEEEQGALMKDALRADSVAVLLGQALQAQDRALLERCSSLPCKDETPCRYKRWRLEREGSAEVGGPKIFCHWRHTRVLTLLPIQMPSWIGNMTC